MLTPEGPKLLDFGGLARGRSRRDGLDGDDADVLDVVGGPSLAAPYMAPEQFAGLEADARTDIFAFGAILYEMVAGRPAFQEKTQALLDCRASDGRSRASIEGAADGSARARLPDQTLSEQGSATAAADRLGLLMELQWIVEASVQVAVPVPVAARRPARVRLFGRRWAFSRRRSGAGAVAVAGFSLRPNLKKSASRPRTWLPGRRRSRYLPTAAG